MIRKVFYAFTAIILLFSSQMVMANQNTVKEITGTYTTRTEIINGIPAQNAGLPTEVLEINWTFLRDGNLRAQAPSFTTYVPYTYIGEWRLISIDDKVATIEYWVKNNFIDRDQLVTQDFGTTVLIEDVLYGEFKIGLKNSDDPGAIEFLMNNTYIRSLDRSIIPYIFYLPGTNVVLSKGSGSKSSFDKVKTELGLPDGPIDLNP